MKSFAKLSAAQLRRYAKLQQKKFRREEGLFVIEGPHLVEEALKSDWEVQALLCTAEFAASGGASGIISAAGRKGVGTHGVTEHEIAKVGDAVTTQGVVGIVARRDYSLRDAVSTAARFVVALEDVTDPGNVGSIIRTCSWFGIDAVLLNRGSVELYNPKVLRSTMGGLFHLPVVPDVNLADAVEELKKRGFVTASTVIGEAENLERIRRSDKLLILFGNESRGLSPELRQTSDLRFAIPGFGKAESLNVAAAAAATLALLRIPQIR